MAGGLFYGLSGGGTLPGGSYNAVVGCDGVIGSKFIHLTGGGMASSAEYAEINVGENYPGDLDVDAWQNRATIANVVSENVDMDSFAICSKHKAQYRQKPFQVPHAATRPQTVNCPGSEHVTSGGWRHPDGYGVSVRSSRPFDDGDRNKAPDDGWEVRMTNESPATIDASAWATCSDKFDPAYRKRSVSIPSPVRQTDAAVRCTKKQHVLGGGAHGSGGGRHNIVGTFITDGGDADSKPDDGFVAALDTYSNFAEFPNKLTVYAICKR